MSAQCVAMELMSVFDPMQTLERGRPTHKSAGGLPLCETYVRLPPSQADHSLSPIGRYLKLPPLTGGSDMSSKDLEYYRERARTERALADAAEGRVAEIHIALAEQYEALIGKVEALSPCGRARD